MHHPNGLLSRALARKKHLPIEAMSTVKFSSKVLGVFLIKVRAKETIKVTSYGPAF